MALDNSIMTNIKEAMLAKDEVRLRTLRSIKTAFTNAKTEKGSTGTLTEDQETKILQKLYSQRKEALSLYESQNREDLAQKEKELDQKEKELAKKEALKEKLALQKEKELAKKAAEKPENTEPEAAAPAEPETKE
mgnify:CR=1 FL=1